MLRMLLEMSFGNQFIARIVRLIKQDIDLSVLHYKRTASSGTKY